MAHDLRRFDEIEKVVRDLRRAHEDAITTVLARLGAHAHPLDAGTVDHGSVTGLADNDHPQYVLHAVADVKGDLLAATGPDALTRVTVGTNNQVLMANSAAAAGVKWETHVRTGSASIATVETTTSATYTDLATAGPAVTIEVGPLGVAVVFVTSGIAAVDSEGYASVAVTGANTVSALDNNAAQTNIGVTGFVTTRYTAVSIFSGLTAGSTTFTMKYRRASGADPAEFYIRKLNVLTF